MSSLEIGVNPKAIPDTLLKKERKIQQLFYNNIKELPFCSIILFLQKLFIVYVFN